MNVRQKAAPGGRDHATVQAGLAKRHFWRRADTLCGNPPEWQRPTFRKTPYRYQRIFGRPTVLATNKPNKRLSAARLFASRSSRTEIGRSAQRAGAMRLTSSNQCCTRTISRALPGPGPRSITKSPSGNTSYSGPQ